MKQLIETLYRGETLSFSDARILFKEMFTGSLDPATIAGILIALKVKGEASSEIAALVKTLRECAVPFSSPKGLFADSCGTGGDGLNTLNVSTASAFVAAECGLPMVKHGNRSVSSRFGSADIIEALGIDLDSSNDKSRECLDLHNYSFIFAPKYHPLMASVTPVRKQLATPTIFNLAGPLANPAAPPVQLMGVCRKELCQTLAEVLLQLDCKRALVVYGAGLDEIALHDETTAVMVDNGKLSQLTLTPEEAGLSRQPLQAIQLDDSDQPVEIFLDVLKGNGTVAMTDIVAFNSGTLLWLAGLYDSIYEATKVAKQTIVDGAVVNRLSAIQEFYHD